MKNHLLKGSCTDSLDPKGYQKIFQQKPYGPEGSSRCIQGYEKKKIPNKNFLSGKIIIQN